MKSEEILKGLDSLFASPHCELKYNKDYELLIALVLSSHSTDKVVNKVTEVLFSKYDIYSLSKANISDIERIIFSVGTYKRKAKYIITIATSLVNDYKGIVPNNRKYLESLPGIGRKTCNVFLSIIYNKPLIAVDTHVNRVANRLGLTKSKDVNIIEKDLMKFFPKEKWSRVHLQLVLFGRYICKSKKPECNICPFKNKCKYLT